MFVLTNHLSMSVGYDAMLTKQDALADAYYKQVVLKVSQSVRDGQCQQKKGTCILFYTGVDLSASSFYQGASTARQDRSSTQLNMTSVVGVVYACTFSFLF